MTNVLKFEDMATNNQERKDIDEIIALTEYTISQNYKHGVPTEVIKWLIAYAYNAGELHGFFESSK